MVAWDLPSLSKKKYAIHEAKAALGLAIWKLNLLKFLTNRCVLKTKKIRFRPLLNLNVQKNQSMAYT